MRRMTHEPARNKSLPAGVIVTLVLVWVFAGWRWTLAVAALLIVLALTQRPVVPGMPQALPHAAEGVSLAGLSVRVTPGGGPELFSVPEPTRLATQRDQTYWRRMVAVLSLLPFVSVAWSAGLLSDSVMLRVCFAGVALLSLIAFLWQLPHVSDRAAYQPTPKAAKEWVTVWVVFGPSVFWSVFWRLSLTSPLITGLLASSRHRRTQRSRRSPRSRVLVRLSSATAPLTAIAILAAMAATPHRRGWVEDLVGLAVIGVEVIAIAFGLFAARRRGVAFVAGYVVLVGALVLGAYRLGLLDSWFELLT